MSRNIHGTLLQHRSYSDALQRAFAQLSGDDNPMHVDPVAARRTLVGGLAVHGIHLALASLEAVLNHFARQGETERTLAGLKAQFLKPVFVGDTVGLYLSKLSDEGCLVSTRIEGELVSWLSIQFGPLRVAAAAELPSLPRESVTELAFVDLRERSGRLALGIEANLAHQLFPLTTAKLGVRRVAAVVALSRLVGMHCPGLYSIFAKASVRFDGDDDTDWLSYRVEEAEERYSHVALGVQGGHIEGKLTAFFRPPPQVQPSLAEVMTVVKPGCLAGSVALIVGGSRGLGEITAKIIAAGGGFPIITYHHGAADAAKVAEEIRGGGGRCEVVQLDVENDVQINRLAEGCQEIRSLYYFATPKIPGRQRGFFDHRMLRRFLDIYVTSFGRLVDAVAEVHPSKVRVFYPSSVMVSDGGEKMEEYIMAKRLAEELCAFYKANSNKVEIVIERLPRVKTDQTNAVMALPALDALEVMVPLVQRVEGL